MSELKEQKYILEIAKHQGISEAAKKLYISQPALSRFLTNTERKLGVKLFERLGKKLVPTYAGKQYINYALSMIDLDDAFASQISDIKIDKKGALAFGSTPGRGKNIFPTVIPKFCKLYPEFELKIYQEIVVKLEEYLRNGTIQLAMMTLEEGTINHKDFVIEEISTEEIVLLVPKDRQVRSYEKFGFRHPWVDIREFNEDIFLLLNNGTRLRSSEDKILKEASLEPKTMEFTSIDTILEMVAQDFGVAMASDFLYENFRKVNVYSVGFYPIRWKFVLMTRVGSYISMPIKTMMDITRKIYGNQ